MTTPTLTRTSETLEPEGRRERRHPSATRRLLGTELRSLAATR